MLPKGHSVQYSWHAVSRQNLGTLIIRIGHIRALGFMLNLQPSVTLKPLSPKPLNPKSPNPKPNSPQILNPNSLKGTLKGSLIGAL